MYKYSGIAFVMVSLILAAAAWAQPMLDVAVSTESVCPCSTMTLNDFEIYAENAGVSEETYSLKLIFPDNEMWSGFIVPEVTLDAGERKSVSSFITPSCSLPPGEYTLSVSAVEQSTGRETVNSFDVSVGKCRWVSIAADDHDACQEKASAFSIMLVNEGEQKETVMLKADPSWISLSEDAVSLEPGEKKPVDMMANPPEGTEGETEVTLRLSSSQSYVSNSETFVLDVQDCYSSDFDVTPLRADICPCKSAEFELVIENTGLLEDQFEVIYGNQKDTLLLQPGGKGTVSLFVDIPCSRESGEYPIPIDIDSSSPIKTSITVGVHPYEYCYSANLSVGSVKEYVEVGDSVTVGIDVENNGQFEQDYGLDLMGPEWVYITEDAVTIPAGEKQTVYVYLAPEYDTEERTYVINLTAYGENYETYEAFEIFVVSSFMPQENRTSEENDSGEPETDIGIPTGDVIGGDGAEEPEGQPWSQIALISVLAIAVVFILVLRFVVMIR